MSQTALNALSWPLATIDFEASSLEWDGYPIEVGIAVWQAADAPILGWSALIRPPLAWREGGHWSRASAKVHGITMSDLLAYGLPVDEVAATLDALLAPCGTAWCDGGRFDADWLASLFRVVRRQPGFWLGDWIALLSHQPATDRRPTHAEPGVEWRHRARDDAEGLLLTLAERLGLPPPTLRDLIEPDRQIGKDRPPVSTP